MENHVMNHFTTDHPVTVSKPICLSPQAWGLIRWALVPLCVMAFYCGSFIWHFEILGDPVRDNAHGWLGPVIRGDSHTVDIGKVGFYEGTDLSFYRTYRPLCVIWLRVQGLYD
jgi:hypothetical protein